MYKNQAMVPVAFLLSPYWKFSFKGGGTVSLLHAGNRKSTQVGYPEATTFFSVRNIFPYTPARQMQSLSTAESQVWKKRLISSTEYYSKNTKVKPIVRKLQN